MDIEEFEEAIINKEANIIGDLAFGDNEMKDPLLTSFIVQDGWSLGSAVTSLGSVIGTSIPRRRNRRRRRIVPMVPPKPVEVKVFDDTVTIINGYPHTLKRILARYYNTGKINHLWLDKQSLSFKLYFALDVYRSFMWLLEYDNPSLAPTIKLRIRDAANQILKKTWVGKSNSKPDPLDKKYLKNLNITLFDHQEPLIDFYNKTTKRLNLRGVIVSATMGSGKTILSLAMAECAKSDLVVIIAPLATIHKVWETTIKQIYKKKQSYWLSTGGGEPNKNHRFVVLHYETLHKVKNYIKRLNIGGRTTVILDESHNLNAENSVRTKSYIKIIDTLDPYMVLPMSGTSIKAQTKELIPSFRAIDPLFTEDNVKRFKMMYSGNNPGTIKLLRQRVTDLMYVVEKNEIGVPPPEKIEVFVKVPDSERFTIETIKAKLKQFIIERKQDYEASAPQDRKVFYGLLDVAVQNATDNGDTPWLTKYNEYLKNLEIVMEAKIYMDLVDEMKFCNRFEKNEMATYLSVAEYRVFKEIKTQVKYYELKVVGEAIGNVLTKARTEAHVAMIQHADVASFIEASLSKTLFFFTSRDVGDTLMDMLDQLDYNAVSVYGESSKSLDKNVKAFANDKTVNPMAASFKTLGTGVPLTMASTVVICELPYRDYILQQGIARVVRIGQPHPTTTIFLILDTDGVPNISTRSKDIIRWAEQQVEIITGVKVESTLVDDFTQEVSPSLYDPSPLDTIQAL